MQEYKYVIMNKQGIFFEDVLSSLSRITVGKKKSAGYMLVQYPLWLLLNVNAHL